MAGSNDKQRPSRLRAELPLPVSGDAGDTVDTSQEDDEAPQRRPQAGGGRPPLYSPAAGASRGAAGRGHRSGVARPPVADHEPERTVVDLYGPAGTSALLAGGLRGHSKHLQRANDTDEIGLDELESLFDEEVQTTTAPRPPSGGLRAPAPGQRLVPGPPILPRSDGVPEARGDAPNNADNTVPHRGRKAGLPLPAPAADSVMAPLSHAPDEHGRRTLAGTKKSKSQQPPMVHGGRPLSAPGRGAAVRNNFDEHEQATAVAQDPLAALKVPMVGGRYRILEHIGVGGMGKVYKVTHSQLGKTFALKIISDSLARDDKMRDLFYREARMASSLSHPNIASVVDFGEDPQFGVFMVMEFVHGEPLAKLLHRERQLAVRLAAEITLQVGEALEYIHGKGIVHCDIKTENILLAEIPGGKQRKPQAKLLDFGLARSTAATRQTASLAGTPHYVAPERIRGEQASPSTDIYGLGILFYEMVTGEVPWDGTVEAILHGHLERPPRPPSQLIEGGLDPAVEALVLRSLAKNPAERHGDMAALLHELQTAMDSMGYQRGQRGGRRDGTHQGNERDELVQALFDTSRVPLALISQEGMILAANPAFAKFVMGGAAQLEGTSVQTTPLMQAWSSLEADLVRACRGQEVRRTIQIDVDNGARRLLMWLEPGSAEEQAIFGVHPLDD